MSFNNGRKDNKMSGTAKLLGSNESDDHLGKLGKLRRDAEGVNLSFINRLREKEGLEPLVSNLPEKEESKAMEEGEDDLGLRPGELIECWRIYNYDDGSAVGVDCSEDEFVASHRKVRRERATYRELDGRLATYGEVYAERKGGDFKEKDGRSKRKSKDRRGACPLRSLMLRVMPHEGKIYGEWLSKKDIATAVDAAVLEFMVATGAEVISAVVHRMTGHDLHIHIQYTMVQEFSEPSKTFAQRHNVWKKAGVEIARAELMAEGDGRPHNRTIGVRRRELVEAGKIGPEPVRERMFRKIPALRSIADGAILGYTLRNKLNLVRAAEAGSDPELAGLVASKRDERGKFRAYLKESDTWLCEKFLDLWMERVWRKSLNDQLSPDAQKEMVVAGVESARDYVVLGSSVPEPTHFERAKADLKDEADMIRIKQKELDTVKANQSQAQRDALELIRKRLSQIKVDTDALELREKALSKKEEDAILAEAKAKKAQEAAQKAEAAAAQQMREALEPPPLEEVAGKMGYVVSSDHEGLIRPTGGPYPEEVLITGRKFAHEFSGHPQGKITEGSGAVELLALDDIHKTTKRSKLQLLGELIKWFPNRAVGLLREALGPGGSTLVEQLLNINKTPAKAPAKAAKRKEDL